MCVLVPCVCLFVQLWLPPTPSKSSPSCPLHPRLLAWDAGAEDPSLFEGEELPDSEEEEEEEDDSEDEAGAAVEDASLFKDLGDEDLPSDSDEDDPDYKP